MTTFCNWVSFKSDSKTCIELKQPWWQHMNLAYRRSFWRLHSSRGNQRAKEWSLFRNWFIASVVHLPPTKLSHRALFTWPINSVSSSGTVALSPLIWLIVTSRNFVKDTGSIRSQDEMATRTTPPKQRRKFIKPKSSCRGPISLNWLQLDLGHYLEVTTWKLTLFLLSFSQVANSFVPECWYNNYNGRHHVQKDD